MPLFEGICHNPGCAASGFRQEHYYSNRELPMAPCDECGGPTVRVPSEFGIVWTGPITAKYLDKSKEGGNKKDGGHWAFENGAKHGVGAKPVWIDSFSAQKEHCRRNGLALPQEHGNHYEVCEDGKTVKNSVGLPGCEV